MRQLSCVNWRMSTLNAPIGATWIKIPAHMLPVIEEMYLNACEYRGHDPEGCADCRKMIKKTGEGCLDAKIGAEVQARWLAAMMQIRA